MKKLWKKFKAVFWPRSTTWTHSTQVTMAMPKSTVWIHEEHYKGDK